MNVSHHGMVFFVVFFFFCSGMTACTLALAAHVCGKEDVAVYDASWMEYYDRKVRVEE